ncbi:MAG: TRZ/ATZ family hydrolase [Gammaproteobacteria bacterium]|nr:TRZ/ATZ family hydrolase [Gammaproteobacteria bacterium]MCI0590405.1 TRZ/ATZ family hydrolase [Gammaproteobacteria bacterium]
MQIDTVIHARWVIPVEPEGVVYENHAIAIHDGRILEILTSSAANAKYTADAIYRLDRHALIPGLVNCHSHAAMNLFRGLADDLPLTDWLKNYMWPAEERWVSPEFVRDGTRHAVAEMIRGGTTCFNDMYFFPEETAQVAVEVGIRATVGLIIIDLPSAWAKTADEYLVKGEAVHDAYRHNPLINTAFAPHAPYTVSDSSLAHIGVLAEELDIPIHMHVLETAGEVDQSMAQHGEPPLKRLQRLGLLSPRLLAVHMTQIEKEKIAEIAACGLNVVHAPESNLKLASGFCPVHELTQAGVNVALGTDGAASNNDLDMFGEMRSAALLAKAVAGDARAISASKALRMATLNGARALAIDSQIGSLLPEKQADIAAIDLLSIETQPMYNPISQIVYATGRNRVTDVWVAGKQLLKDGVLTSLNEQAVIKKTREWQQKIAGTRAKR